MSDAQIDDLMSRVLSNDEDRYAPAYREIRARLARLSRAEELLAQAAEVLGKCNACASLPDHTRELCREIQPAIRTFLKETP